MLTGGFCAALIFAALAASLHYASPVLRSPLSTAALLIVLPISFATIWFQGVRLARLAGPPATALPAFFANALSSCVFVVVPARVSEVVKPAALRIQTGLPLANGFAALALERLLDIGCLAFLTALAGLTVATQYSGDLQRTALVLTFVLSVGLVVLAALALRPDFGLHMIRYVPGARLRATARDLLEALLRGGSFKLLGPAVWQSIVIWCGSILTTYLLIQLVGAIPLSAAQVLFVFVAGTLGFVITVTPGGLGTFEGATVLAMGSFGYTIADAVAIALLVRIANLLPSIVGTAWVVAQGSISLSDLFGHRRTDDPS
jgi:hypothetical protein